MTVRLKNTIDVYPYECDHTSIIFDQTTSEQICSQCGLVIEERMIDYGNEGRRSFSREEKDQRAQYGPPTPNHASSIYLSLPLTKEANKNRICKWNYSNAYQRNYHTAHVQINRISGELKLPKTTRHDAEVLYLKALENNLIKGRSIIGMVAACILYIGRKNGNHIKEEEIVALMEGHIDPQYNDPLKHVRKCYSVLMTELGLKSFVADPLLLIFRYVSELGLDEQVGIWTVEFYERFVAHQNLMGKNPKGIAAASIYATCCIHNLSVSQKKVAHIAGITDATLRSRKREFDKFIAL